MTHSFHRRVAVAASACLVLLASSGCAGFPTIDGSVFSGPKVSIPGVDGPPPIAAPIPRSPESSPDGPMPGDPGHPLPPIGDGRATPPIGEAAAALGTLRVRGRGTLTGYSRTRFGEAWTDIEGDGCDQRNQVLARDMTDEVYRRGSRKCVVSTGRLRDPYTAKEISFRRGNKTSELIQIDHVVALSNAWQSGADQYDDKLLLRLANDPLNLLAVDGRTNQAKGDSDAATWLPPNKGYRCAYVSRQVAVKLRYRLSVTSNERAAMEKVLSGCAGQRLITD